MRTPESLETLLDHGIIQEVVRPLMSGKEAQVYVVVVAGEECVAKVYKEASQRNFKHRSEYTEGRRTRNTRDQRAVNKRTRHGRKQDESAWRNAEADMIYRLRDAGVRVPEPINFVDGVLVMELVKDAQGNPAPRLGDLSYGPHEAHEIYQQLLREVVRMLCAGVIHGDLSDFNVLMGVGGPVVIDFPQSVDAAHNQNARKLLLRDVDNLHRFLERCAPRQATHLYAEEMWSLYEVNRLEPDTELRGDYQPPEAIADTAEVLALIEDANREEQGRRDARGDEAPVSAPNPLRTVVDFTQEARPPAGAAKRSGEARGAGRAGDRRRPAEPSVSAKVPAAGAAPLKKKRRSRRRRKSSSAAAGEAGATANARPQRKEAAAAPRHKPAARPAKPAAGPRGGKPNTTEAAAAERPARRRRRRPRAASSRKPS